MTTNSQNAAEMAAAAQSDLLQALDRRGELTVVEAALCCVAHELAAQRASRDGFPDSLGRMSIEAHQRSQWEDQVAALTARVAALEEAGDALHKYADDEFVDAVGLSYPSECCGCSCGNDGDGWNEPACECGHQDGCTYVGWLRVAEAWEEVRGG